MITKSDLLLFLETPLHLWALKNDQFTSRPVSAYQKFLRKQAEEIEILADKYLNDRITSPSSILRQPPFTSGNFHARADFLVHREDGRYDLYEVKSSTKVKPEHILDIAFQTLIIADHHQLANIYLLHINSEYLKKGAVDPEGLFTEVNITEQVFEQLETVDALRHDILRKTSLSLDELRHAFNTEDRVPGCSKPATCPCQSLCFPNLPDYPIYQLPRLGKKANSLAEQGIYALTDIPDSFRLSEVQRRHVLAATGNPQIDLDAIRNFISGISYPLHFLDYETYPAGVPIMDNYRPYEHTAFQFSLHIIDKPGSTPRQFEYLHKENSDPAPELSRRLSQVIIRSGSVLTWNQSFEKARNRDLSHRLPGMADFFGQLNERIIDLMVVFSKGMYVHRDFKGSASLKNIVPVIVPEMDYSLLNIQQGDEAMLAWHTLIFDNLSEKERLSIIQDLLSYCHADTEVMVAIWEKLVTLAG